MAVEGWRARAATCVGPASRTLAAAAFDERGDARRLVEAARGGDRVALEGVRIIAKLFAVERDSSRAGGSWRRPRGPAYEVGEGHRPRLYPRSALCNPSASSVISSSPVDTEGKKMLNPPDIEVTVKSVNLGVKDTYDKVAKQLAAAKVVAGPDRSDQRAAVLAKLSSIGGQMERGTWRA